MPNIPPIKVLEQLKKDSSMRVCNSLDSIFRICKEQEERGVNDFSYSTIAKLGQGRGVPAAQSIRNKTGEPYQTLIKSFEVKNLRNEKAQPISTKSTKYSWIDELEDPVIRLQANILYAQKKEAEKLLKEVVPINQVIQVFDNRIEPSTTFQLDDLERQALEYLLSDEFLRKQGLEFGKNGTIVDSITKDTYFPVATVDALKKSLYNL